MKEERADNASPLAALNPLIVFSVLIPIAATMLITRVFFKEMTSSLTAGFVMFPFLVYVGFNFLTVIGGAFALRSRLRWRDIGFRHFRWKDVFLGAGAAIVGIFIVYPLAMFLAGIIGFAGMKGMSYSLDDTLNIFSAVLIASLIGPLAEDIIFRGFLLSFLRDKYARPWLTVAGGIVLFTFVHVFYFGWSGVLFIFLWTPLSVGLFLWRKSIYPCLVLHTLNNIVAYVLVPVLLK